ncbi:hypothetical protein TthSNM11_24700 (plasmid) [Thermus thermophilus]|uniref:hypothetical protein n=1 Tax=Thermus thermophilus TaxID=274 RepID=UPI001FCDFC73|nr:hypothetical protein [Thermus thermophilus]BDG20267.1 hypothetical protein TthSNM11_24700 [Thermus thermophilus]BDG22609.1 hypothetical protein TthSNM17_22710 [Thermus thermophilus]
MKRVIGLPISLLLMAFSGVQAQGLSLGEHLVLRGYTGQAFGKAMAEVLGLKSVHVLTNNTSICAALVGAMGAGYLDGENRRRMAVTVLSAPAEVPPLSPKEEAVALIYGGQATPETNYGLTLESLRALAQANYPGALFFHLRVWVPGFVAKAAQEDVQVARYLAGKSNLFAVTADLNAKVVRLWQVAVRDGKQSTVKELGTVPLNPVWEDLLRRSL